MKESSEHIDWWLSKKETLNEMFGQVIKECEKLGPYHAALFSSAIEASLLEMFLLFKEKRENSPVEEALDIINKDQINGTI